MKPDWKDAPEWAQWLAMDEDGVWVWYENKPVLKVRIFFPSSGKYQDAKRLGFRESLEPRP